jgi:Carbohydrate-selective porin, OprB family
LFAGTSAEVADAFPSVLPFASEGQGALSRFGSLPAAHRVSGGTSGTGLASAAGVIVNVSEAIDFRALYGSVNAALPSNAGFPGTPLGAGIGGGSYVAAAQLTIKPSKSIDVALNYAHSYHQINILGTGLSTADIGAVIFNPTAAEIATRGAGLGVTGAVANQGIKLNTVGLTTAFRLTPQVTLAGSASFILSDLVSVDASTNFLSWLVGVHVKDVFSKGGAVGLLAGQPLHRIGTGGRAIDPETANPFQVEGFINYRVNDNISVTPGVFVIFNPEGFSENNTVVVPVIRTTFTF